MKNISDKDTFEKREEKKLFIETYGCQMNVADSEVVAPGFYIVRITRGNGGAVVKKILVTE